MAAAYEKGDREFCGLKLPEGSGDLTTWEVRQGVVIPFDLEIFNTPVVYKCLGLKLVNFKNVLSFHFIENGKIMRRTEPSHRDGWRPHIGTKQ